MEWTPSDIISAVTACIALVSVVVTGSVAVTSVRRQQRVEAANRRRDAHLRFWQSANAALRMLQEREASMRQSDRGKDLPEPDGLTETLSDARGTLLEIEIVSPSIVAECSKAVAALTLARGDVHALAELRRHHGTGSSSGADLRNAMFAARDDLDAARVTLNSLLEALRVHEARGRVPRWRLAR